jgi:hypothetical protein
MQQAIQARETPYCGVESIRAWQIGHPGSLKKEGKFLKQKKN